jgi:hypothetical protein
MAGDVGFSPEDSRVEEVSGIKKVNNDEQGGNASGKKGHEQHKKRHPGEYMHVIGRAARESNEQLAKKGAPYRFRVYESQGEVMIDLVMLDASGNIVKEVKRNITDEDFDRLIENISLIEGLLIDKTG